MRRARPASSAARGRSRGSRGERAKKPIEDVARELVTHVPPELMAALGALGVVALALGAYSLRARRRQRAAERAALTDRLTGIGNRPAFEHRLAVEWERAGRYGRPLGVLVLDLDGFKGVNDTRGHAAGDDVLRRVGDVLARRSRGSDFPARLGGDEFVVVVPETATRGLATFGEALRSEIEQLSIGVSVGWAERLASDDEAADMVRRADAMMYEDKQARRASREARDSSGGETTEADAAREAAPSAV